MRALDADTHAACASCLVLPRRRDKTIATCFRAFQPKMKVSGILSVEL